MHTDYLIWQLCDSAFPTGGFAHSGGLEAAWQQGEVASAGELAAWMRAALGQVGRSMLPFVRAARPAVDEFEPLDRACDAFVLGPVANRASRAQGQAFLAAAGKTFDEPALARLAAAARARRLPAHLAPVFGAVCHALDVEAEQAARLFLFVNLRGMVSAAVRLGATGPMEAQRMQQRLAATAEEAARRSAGVPVAAVAQTAPVLEMLQSTQDRLYSRLFIS